MLRPTHADEVDSYHLGIVDFRILAGTDRTDGAFALGEFSGSEGAWTVPHVHVKSLEAFYVLDGLLPSPSARKTSRPSQGRSS